MHLSPSTVIVEHGSPNVPVGSTRHLLVVRPARESTRRVWVKGVLAGSLATMVLALALAWFRVSDMALDLPNRCVYRARTRGYETVSAALMAALAGVFAALFAWVVVALKRQEGLMGLVYYHMWFRMRVKMLFFSYVFLLVLAIVEPGLVQVVAVVPTIISTHILVMLDYALVFNHVPGHSETRNHRVVRATVLIAFLTWPPTLLELVAGVNQCGRSTPILQMLPVIVATWSMIVGLLSIDFNKFKTPYRPSPTLNADKIAVILPDAEGIGVFVYRDRIKTAPRYYSVNAIISRASSQGLDAPTALGGGSGGSQGSLLGEDAGRATPSLLDKLHADKEKKLASDAEADQPRQYEEAALNPGMALFKTYVFSALRFTLAAVMLVRGIYTAVVDVAPAVRSHCVENFSADYLRVPPIALSGGIALLAGVVAWLRPALKLNDEKKRGIMHPLGALAGLLALHRFFYRHNLLLVTLALVWVALEVLDLLVVGSSQIASLKFVSILEHVIFGPMLMVHGFYHTLIISPFVGLSRVHKAANGLLLVALCVDALVLYIELYIGRKFSCTKRATDATAIVIRTNTTVGGFVIINLLRMYLDALFNPTRPCMTAGDRSKFLIIQSVETSSLPTPRRRDHLLRIKPTPPTPRAAKDDNRWADDVPAPPEEEPEFFVTRVPAARAPTAIPPLGNDFKRSRSSQLVISEWDDDEFDDKDRVQKMVLAKSRVGDDGKHFAVTVTTEPGGPECVVKTIDPGFRTKFGSIPSLLKLPKR